MTGRGGRTSSRTWADSDVSTFLHASGYLLATGSVDKEEFLAYSTAKGGVAVNLFL